MSDANRLIARGIDVSFAGVHALRSVDLELLRGQIVGLIGPNGAGKTTLVNVLTGFQSSTEGTLTLGGMPLVSKKADDFRRLGIARTFQGGRLFRELSVLDNLEVAAVGLGQSRRQARVTCLEVLHWLGLAHLAQTVAGALPYTDERRVGIARAVVGHPQHLLMDEPAAGMSEHEANDLQELIARIVRDIGCSVLLIEHNVRLVLSTCNPIVMMDAGSIIERGDPATIQASERVRHAYMGTAADVQGVAL